MARPYKISEQDRLDICKKYQEGLNTSELSEMYCIAVVSIRKLLIKNNVQIRSKKESKQLDSFKDKIRGENNWAWKGGVTKLKNKIRMLPEYAIWRTKVYERDNYTCCNCGKRCSKGNKIILNCDHIIPLSQIVEEYNITSIEEATSCQLLWDTENGRTLCYDCHLETETYGFNYEHHKRKVIQLSINGDEIKKYNSIIECSKELNIHRSSINRVCSGEYQSAKGFKFQYENN
jgi:hypothetical protein